MLRRHRGTPVLTTCKLSISSLSGLPVSSSHTICLLWKRGRHRGCTLKSLQRHGQIDWDEEFFFPCTLYRISDSSRFESKNLDLRLQEVCPVPHLFPFPQDSDVHKGPVHLGPELTVDVGRAAAVLGPYRLELPVILPSGTATLKIALEVTALNQPSSIVLEQIRARNQQPLNTVSEAKKPIRRQATMPSLSTEASSGDPSMREMFSRLRDPSAVSKPPLPPQPAKLGHRRVHSYSTSTAEPEQQSRTNVPPSPRPNLLADSDGAVALRSFLSPQQAPPRQKGHRRSLSVDQGSPLTGHRRSVSLDISSKGLETPSEVSADEAHEIIFAQQCQIDELKRMLREKEDEDDLRILVDATVRFAEPVIAEDLPALACILFRCLQHRRGDGADNTKWFDGIVKAISQTVGRHMNDKDLLAYWLSGCVFLINMMRREYYNTPGSTRQGAPITGLALKKETASVLHFQDALTDVATGLARQLLQSTTVVLTRLTIPALLDQPSPFGGKSDSSAALVRPEAVVNELASFWNILETAKVPEAVALQLGARAVSIVDALAFNELMTRSSTFCCSVGLGIKMALSPVEQWASAVLSRKKGHSIEGPRVTLRHVRQAVDVLSTDKGNLASADVRCELCPDLSLGTLLHLVSSYSPDEFDSTPIDADLKNRLTKEAKRLTASIEVQNLSSPLDHDFPIDLECIYDSPGERIERMGAPDDLRSRDAFVWLN